MKTITHDRPRIFLVAPLILVAVGLVAVACDDARTHAPKVHTARYFGDEFALAQLQLLERPAAEMPQAF